MTVGNTSGDETCAPPSAGDTETQNMDFMQQEGGVHEIHGSLGKKVVRRTSSGEVWHFCAALKCLLGLF